MEAIAVAEAIATVRGHRDMGTVFFLARDGSYHIDLSTADLEGHCPLVFVQFPLSQKVVKVAQE